MSTPRRQEPANLLRRSTRKGRSGQKQKNAGFEEKQQRRQLKLSGKKDGKRKSKKEKTNSRRALTSSLEAVQEMVEEGEDEEDSPSLSSSSSSSSSSTTSSSVSSSSSLLTTPLDLFLQEENKAAEAAAAAAAAANIQTNIHIYIQTFSIKCSVNKHTNITMLCNIIALCFPRDQLHPTWDLRRPAIQISRHETLSLSILPSVLLTLHDLPFLNVF
jgi:hypothetical protein